MGNKRVKIICLALLCIMLFAYLTICVNSIMNGNKMAFLSYRFYVLTSDSEESDANTGDLIIANSVNVDSIKANDDIIYKKDDKMIIKKVIGTDGTSNNKNIYVENDNVIMNDSIENAQILGKVIKKVSGIGNVALYVQSPMGTLNIILIIVCVFILIKKLVR